MPGMACFLRHYLFSQNHQETDYSKRTALYSVNVLCSGSSISWGTKILLENDVIVCNGHVMLF